MKGLKKGDVARCYISFDFLMDRMLYPTRYFPKGSLDSSHVMRLLSVKVQMVSVRMKAGVLSSHPLSRSKKTE